MLLKISEILIDKKTQATIVENWSKRGLESKNHEILEDEYLLQLTLRVPFGVKGTTIHMLIPSKLEMLNKKNHVVLAMYCNQLKPMIISLILGVLSSVLFYTIYFSLMYFIIMTIVISLVYFGVFYYAISKRSSEYLFKLKTNT